MWYWIPKSLFLLVTLFPWLSWPKILKVSPCLSNHLFQFIYGFLFLLMALKTWSAHSNTRLTVDKIFGSSHLCLASSLLLFVFFSFFAHHSHPPYCFLNDHVKCKSELAVSWLNFCFSSSCLSDEIPLLYMTWCPHGSLCFSSIISQLLHCILGTNFFAYTILVFNVCVCQIVSSGWKKPLLSLRAYFTGTPSFIPSLAIGWASLVAQLVKNPPTMWETWVWSLGWEIPWRKEHIAVFWPGEFHGLYSSRGCKQLDTTVQLSLSPLDELDVTSVTSLCLLNTPITALFMILSPQFLEEEMATHSSILACKIPWL